MKNTYYPLFLVLLIIAIACKKNRPAPSDPDLSMQELVLKNAYEIQNAIFEEEPLEPSGIIGRNDSLFFISDNHDQSIFLLQQAGNGMQWKEVIRFKAQTYNRTDIGEALRMAGTFDFSDIFYFDNQIYVLDRNAQCIIRVDEQNYEAFEAEI